MTQIENPNPELGWRSRWVRADGTLVYGQPVSTRAGAVMDAAPGDATLRRGIQFWLAGAGWVTEKLLSPRERERATDAGQETCPHAWWQDKTEACPYCPAPQQPPVSLSQQRRLDVQQPPAQEREAVCTCPPDDTGSAIEYETCEACGLPYAPGPTQERPEPGSEAWGAMIAANKAAGWHCGRGLAEGYCDNPDHARKGAHPPSEADSAGEVERVVADLLETDALTGNSEGTPDMYSIHPDDVPHLVRTVLALAASSGVRGGDDQARERLADDVEHAQAWWVCITQGIDHEAFVIGLAEAFAEVRAAGGQR